MNATALAKVRDDKTRESGDGFDGSWVAHPDLVALCKEVFDAALGDRPNQLDRLREEVSVSAQDLLAVAKTPGRITEAGLRNNVSVALQYLATWLGGNGAVAIFNLMEDAATAEIARSQVWQWLHNGVTLDDGPLVTRDLVERIMGEELDKIRASAGAAFDAPRYDQAAALFTEVGLADDLRRVPHHPRLRAHALTPMGLSWLRQPRASSVIAAPTVTYERRAPRGDGRAGNVPGWGATWEVATRPEGKR